MDSRIACQRVLTLCGCHLQSYIQAKEAAKQSGPGEPSQLWEAYCRASAPHPAVQSPSAGHLRTWHRECVASGTSAEAALGTRTGEHIVVELITCNVILPLISKLSDPDWIHLVLRGHLLKAQN